MKMNRIKCSNLPYRPLPYFNNSRSVQTKQDYETQKNDEKQTQKQKMGSTQGDNVQKESYQPASQPLQLQKEKVNRINCKNLPYRPLSYFNSIRKVKGSNDLIAEKDNHQIQDVELIEVQDYNSDEKTYESIYQSISGPDPIHLQNSNIESMKEDMEDDIEENMENIKGNVEKSIIEDLEKAVKETLSYDQPDDVQDKDTSSSDTSEKMTDFYMDEDLEKGIEKGIEEDIEVGVYNTVKKPDSQQQTPESDLENKTVNDVTCEQPVTAQHHVSDINTNRTSSINAFEMLEKLYSIHQKLMG
jgi:hypothetical protein